MISDAMMNGLIDKMRHTFRSRLLQCAYGEEESLYTVTHRLTLEGRTSIYSSELYETATLTFLPNLLPSWTPEQKQYSALPFEIAMEAVSTTSCGSYSSNPEYVDIAQHQFTQLRLAFLRSVEIPMCWEESRRVDGSLSVLFGVGLARDKSVSLRLETSTEELLRMCANGWNNHDLAYNLGLLIVRVLCGATPYLQDIGPGGMPEIWRMRVAKILQESSPTMTMPRNSVRHSQGWGTELSGVHSGALLVPPRSSLDLAERDIKFWRVIGAQQNNVEEPHQPAITRWQNPLARKPRKMMI